MLPEKIPEGLGLKWSDNTLLTDINGLNDIEISVQRISDFMTDIDIFYRTETFEESNLKALIKDYALELPNQTTFPELKFQNTHYYLYYPFSSSQHTVSFSANGDVNMHHKENKLPELLDVVSQLTAIILIAMGVDQPQKSNTLFQNLMSIVAVHLASNRNYY